MTVVARTARTARAPGAGLERHEDEPGPPACHEVARMLAFCARHGVRPWAERFGIDDAGEALDRVRGIVAPPGGPRAPRDRIATHG